MPFFQAINRLYHRRHAIGLDRRTEAERYGAAGEDRIYQILSKEFSCVIRNVVVPAGNQYFEKDFLVYESGVAFVIEIKNWRGNIYQDGDDFCQDKEDGTHKVLHNPAFSTADFINAMENFYHLPGGINGMVVFADQSCHLETDDRIEGIWVLPIQRMLSILRSEIRKQSQQETVNLPVQRILHCTRLYSKTEEFSKGLVSDESIACFDKKGEPIALDVSKLKYMRIVHQPLLLRDRLEVIFTNHAPGVYYNHHTNITLCCLDGSCKRVSLSRLQHILF